MTTISVQVGIQHDGPIEFKGKCREAKRTGRAVLITPSYLPYMSSRIFKTLCERSGLSIESSYIFSLKNGPRNLGRYPIPRVSRVAKTTSPDEPEWSSESIEPRKIHAPGFPSLGWSVVISFRIHVFA